MDHFFKVTFKLKNQKFLLSFKSYSSTFEFFLEV